MLCLVQVICDQECYIFSVELLSHLIFLLDYCSPQYSSYRLTSIATALAPPPQLSDRNDFPAPVRPAVAVTHCVKSVANHKCSSINTPQNLWDVRTNCSMEKYQPHSHQSNLVRVGLQDWGGGGGHF